MQSLASFVILAVLALGCETTSPDSCKVTCTTDSECPSGQSCGELGRCTSGVVCSQGGTADASATALTLTASPSSFVLHANDTRDTLLTVTNPTGATTGMPMLAVSGLTLGTMLFSQSTCTSNLAPGASCTAVGTLLSTTEGNNDFQVTATASDVMGAMASLQAMVTAACPSNCGPTGLSNCCASSVVPGNASGATLAGTSFYRSYDASTTDTMYKDMSAPATVSDFRLDTYEVTVGRFRAFVNAGKGSQSGPPSAGAGAHAKLPGSGWDSAWNTNLAADTTALKAALNCQGSTVWTNTPGANEALPMNCMTWYEAMAFCIWDGGYLPTEAEWNYAAVGGSEHRAYPWSSPPSSTTIDCSYANYNPGPSCGAANRVGSESPKGDGRWGHSDLAGNVIEWTLDWYASSYPTPCNDCANLTTASYRVQRSGTHSDDPTRMRGAWRDYDVPAVSRRDDRGVRCARMP